MYKYSVDTQVHVRVLSEYSSTCTSTQWILKYKYSVSVNTQYMYKYSVDTQVHVQVLSGYSSTCTSTQWILKYMYKYSVDT